MIRAQFGDRVFEFDETQKMTMGDLVAVREMGVDLDRWVNMVERLRGVDVDTSANVQLELFEVAAQVAYLAAVRKDHSLTWREFVWTVAPEDLRALEMADAPAQSAKAQAEPPNALGPMVRGRKTKPKAKAEEPAAS